MKINLHTHTDYSIDGTISVRGLIKAANKERFEYFSITDHDSVLAYYDEGTNEPFNGRLITGLEADALVEDVTIEILGYNFDLDKVNQWCLKTYGTRESRQRAIYDELGKLCDDLRIKRDTSLKFREGEQFAHDCIYHQLLSASPEWLESHNITSVSELYRAGTTDQKFPLFIDMNKFWPTIEEVVSVIKEAGGLTFLAHPFNFKKVDTNWLLDKTKDLVDGIEIFNWKQDAEQTKFLYDYAKKHNLLMSLGSDYHGEGKNALLKYDVDPMYEAEALKWLEKI